MLRRRSTSRRSGRSTRRTWAGAVDNLGGDMLAWLLSTLEDRRTVAAVRPRGGHEAHTTVAPFILRGVQLLGIDSGYIREPYRSGVWQRLATDLRPPHLAGMARQIAFDELPATFAEYIAGRAKGRVVVAIGAA